MPGWEDKQCSKIWLIGYVTSLAIHATSRKGFCTYLRGRKGGCGVCAPWITMAIWHKKWRAKREEEAVARKYTPSHFSGRQWRIRDALNIVWFSIIRLRQAMPNRQIRWIQLPTATLLTKPEASALRFGDCTEVWVIVGGADDCLHSYWTAEAGHSTHAVFCHFTQPKSLTSGLPLTHIYFSNSKAHWMLVD